MEEGFNNTTPKPKNKNMDYPHCGSLASSLFILILPCCRVVLKGGCTYLQIWAEMLHLESQHKYLNLKGGKEQSSSGPFNILIHVKYNLWYCRLRCSSAFYFQYIHWYPSLPRNRAGYIVPQRSTLNTYTGTPHHEKQDLICIQIAQGNASHQDILFCLSGKF